MALVDTVSHAPPGTISSAVKPSPVTIKVKAFSDPFELF